MSRRLRMTMVYEFSWSLDTLTEDDVHRLVENFLGNPRAFLNLDYPEWDEEILVDVQDITEE